MTCLCKEKDFSTFEEFCVDGINLYVENNFIDSLGLGRDSNPDPSALKPSECTTTPSTSKIEFESYGKLSSVYPSHDKLNLIREIVGEIRNC
jgi:hypothetical protein